MAGSGRRDAAHRATPAVESIRTGKNTGLPFPSRDYGLNASWLDAAMTLRLCMA